MSDSNDPLQAAVNRLDRALTQVEQRMSDLNARAEAAISSDASDADRARLAGELDDARASEAAMAELLEEASSSLGAAIAELREAVQEAEAATGASSDV